MSLRPQSVGSMTRLGLLASIVLLWCAAVPARSAQVAEIDRTGNPHGDIALECSECHTSVSWRPLRPVPDFDHNIATAFPLTGLHAGVSCTACHVRPVFAEVGAQCGDCHADIHRGQFSAACADCHSPERPWPVTDNAVAQHLNRFPLMGAHASANCEACHSGAAVGEFVGLDTECISCHAQEYESAATIDHVAANLPTTCERCHTVGRWDTAAFDHDASRFPLTGAHTATECNQCHIDSQFTGLDTTCFGCHADDFNGTTTPNHLVADFSTDCTTCHTTEQWLGASFDHNTTVFPLTGAHLATACNQCHIDDQFSGLDTTCFGCHADDFAGTVAPNHVAADFPTDCTNCHTTEQWLGAGFDHDLTRFPLTGAHNVAACSACHVDGQFVGLETTCFGCHADDFAATTAPNHLAADFSTDCTTCHTTARWPGAQFDHDTTLFPLTGAHIGTDCTTCHVNDQFTGLDTTCFGCHADDFAATTSPNHVSSGFPTDCTACHTTSEWQGASFDHNATLFPLTGAHASTTCETCHVDDQFSGLGTDCFGCHADSFAATTDPSHTAAGFPTTCELCHDTTAWEGAVFDHNGTRFPLTGAHIAVNCTTCHIADQFAGTPQDCYSCHSTEYTSVASPNHLAAAFPTTCESCHSTTAWTGAVVEHRFPIYSGAHRGQWTSCADCHTNAANFSVFTCLTCHEHSQTSMDDKHSEIGGYVYESLSCYSCHPNGTH